MDPEPTEQTLSMTHSHIVLRKHMMTRPMKLPSSVERSLRVLLETELDHSLSTASVQRVSGTIQHQGGLDYEQDWAPFAYMYFGANFLKTAFAADDGIKVPQSQALRILDLGCGAGAASVGLVSIIEQASAVRSVAITAVDISRAQLTAYNRIVGPWLPIQFKKSDVQCVQADVSTFLAEEGDWDIVLLSYLLCELDERLRIDVSHRLEVGSLFRESMIVVVDQDSSGEPFYWTRMRGRRLINQKGLYVDQAFLKSLGIGVCPAYAKPVFRDDIPSRESHERP